MFALLLALAATPSPPVNTITKTMAPVNLFVDVAGNDSNACTSTGAGACLTPQGAINKVPKSLRHGANVTLGAGSFPAFSVSGFSQDVGAQQSTAGLLVIGTLANSTLATGTATGTATAVAAGATNSFGTLTDGAATWTTDDLQGRFLVITGGTGAGQQRVIVSNTSNTVTIAGVWTSTVPIAGSTYAIQDSASTISTCGATPPPPGQPPPSTANSAIRLSGNTVGSAIELRGLNITAPCTFGVYQADGALLIATRLQFATTSGTASHLAFSGAIHVDSISSKYSGTSGTHITGGGISGFSFSPSQPGAIINPSGFTSGNGGTIQNSLFVNGTGALNLSGYRGNFIGLQINNVNGTGISLSTSTATNLQGINISCTAASSAVAVASTQISSGAYMPPDHMLISGCNTAFQMTGPSAWVDTMNAVTVTGATTGIKVASGALVSLNGSANTFTVSGNEILLDNSVTGTIAGISTGACLTGVAGWGTRVCKP